MTGMFRRFRCFARWRFREGESIRMASRGFLFAASLTRFWTARQALGRPDTTSEIPISATSRMSAIVSTPAARMASPAQPNICALGILARSASANAAPYTSPERSRQPSGCNVWTWSFGRSGGGQDFLVLVLELIELVINTLQPEEFLMGSNLADSPFMHDNDL